MDQTKWIDFVNGRGLEDFINVDLRKGIWEELDFIDKVNLISALHYTKGLYNSDIDKLAANPDSSQLKLNILKTIKFIEDLCYFQLFSKLQIFFMEEYIACFNKLFHITTDLEIISSSLHLLLIISGFQSPETKYKFKEHFKIIQKAWYTLLLFFSKEKSRDAFNFLSEKGKIFAQTGLLIFRAQDTKDEKFEFITEKNIEPSENTSNTTVDWVSVLCKEIENASVEETFLVNRWQKILTDAENEDAIRLNGMMLLLADKDIELDLRKKLHHDLIELMISKNKTISPELQSDLISNLMISKACLSKRKFLQLSPLGLELEKIFLKTMNILVRNKFSISKHEKEETFLSQFITESPFKNNYNLQCFFEQFFEMRRGLQNGFRRLIECKRDKNLVEEVRRLDIEMGSALVGFLKEFFSEKNEHFSIKIIKHAYPNWIEKSILTKEESAQVIKHVNDLFKTYSSQEEIKKAINHNLFTLDAVELYKTIELAGIPAGSGNVQTIILKNYPDLHHKIIDESRELNDNEVILYLWAINMTNSISIFISSEAAEKLKAFLKCLDFIKRKNYLFKGRLNGFLEFYLQSKINDSGKNLFQNMNLIMGVCSIHTLYITDENRKHLIDGIKILEEMLLNESEFLFAFAQSNCLAKDFIIAACCEKNICFSDVFIRFAKTNRYNSELEQDEVIFKILFHIMKPIFERKCYVKYENSLWEAFISNNYKTKPQFITFLANTLGTLIDTLQANENTALYLLTQKDPDVHYCIDYFKQIAKFSENYYETNNVLYRAILIFKILTSSNSQWSTNTSPFTEIIITKVFYFITLLCCRKDSLKNLGNLDRFLHNIRATINKVYPSLTKFKLQLFKFLLRVSEDYPIIEPVSIMQELWNYLYKVSNLDHNAYCLESSKACLDYMNHISYSKESISPGENFFYKGFFFTYENAMGKKEGFKELLIDYFYSFYKRADTDVIAEFNRLYINILPIAPGTSVAYSKQLILCDVIKAVFQKVHGNKIIPLNQQSDWLLKLIIEKMNYVYRAESRNLSDSISNYLSLYHIQSYILKLDVPELDNEWIIKSTDWSSNPRYYFYILLSYSFVKPENLLSSKEILRDLNQLGVYYEPFYIELSMNFIQRAIRSLGIEKAESPKSVDYEIARKIFCFLRRIKDQALQSEPLIKLLLISLNDILLFFFKNNPSSGYLLTHDLFDPFIKNFQKLGNESKSHLVKVYALVFAMEQSKNFYLFDLILSIENAICDNTKALSSNTLKAHLNSYNLTHLHKGLAKEVLDFYQKHSDGDVMKTILNQYKKECHHSSSFSVIHYMIDDVLDRIEKSNQEPYMDILITLLKNHPILRLLIAVKPSLKRICIENPNKAGVIISTLDDLPRSDFYTKIIRELRIDVVGECFEKCMKSSAEDFSEPKKTQNAEVLFSLMSDLLLPAGEFDLIAYVCLNLFSKFANSMNYLNKNLATRDRNLKTLKKFMKIYIQSKTRYLWKAQGLKKKHLFMHLARSEIECYIEKEFAPAANYFITDLKRELEDCERSKDLFSDVFKTKDRPEILLMRPKPVSFIKNSSGIFEDQFYSEITELIRNRGCENKNNKEKEGHADLHQQVSEIETVPEELTQNKMTQDKEAILDEKDKFLPEVILSGKKTETSPKFEIEFYEEESKSNASEEDNEEQAHIRKDNDCFNGGHTDKMMEYIRLREQMAIAEMTENNKEGIKMLEESIKTFISKNGWLSSAYKYFVDEDINKRINLTQTFYNPDKMISLNIKENYNTSKYVELYKKFDSISIEQNTPKISQYKLNGDKANNSESHLSDFYTVFPFFSYEFILSLVCSLFETDQHVKFLRKLCLYPPYRRLIYHLIKIFLSLKAFDDRFLEAFFEDLNSKYYFMKNPKPMEPSNLLGRFLCNTISFLQDKNYFFPREIYSSLIPLPTEYSKFDDFSAIMSTREFQEFNIVENLIELQLELAPNSMNRNSVGERISYMNFLVKHLIVEGKSLKNEEYVVQTLSKFLQLYIKYCLTNEGLTLDCLDFITSHSLEMYCQAINYTLKIFANIERFYFSDKIMSYLLEYDLDKLNSDDEFAITAFLEDFKAKLSKPNDKLTIPYLNYLRLSKNVILYLIKYKAMREAIMFHSKKESKPYSQTKKIFYVRLLAILDNEIEDLYPSFFNNYKLMTVLLFKFNEKSKKTDNIINYNYKTVSLLRDSQCLDVILEIIRIRLKYADFEESTEPSGSLGLKKQVSLSLTKNHSKDRYGSLSLSKKRSSFLFSKDINCKALIEDDWFNSYEITNLFELCKMIIEFGKENLQFLLDNCLDFANNRILESLRIISLNNLFRHKFSTPLKTLLLRKIIKPQIKKKYEYEEDYDNSSEISVRRNCLFEFASINILNYSVPFFVYYSMTIKFLDEPGIDGGGLTREMVNLYMKAISDPRNGLMKLSENKISLQPNPYSSINPDHLIIFETLGMLISKSIIDDFIIGINFTRPFLKLLCDEKVNISDLEDVDQSLTKNLIWLLENDIGDGSDLDIHFCYYSEYLGIKKSHELIKNGDNISVTESNKREYVKLLCNYKMIEEIEPQTKSLLKGLKSGLTNKNHKILEWHTLGMHLVGIQKIDVQELKKYCQYRNCSVDTQEIVWFWEILEELDDNQLSSFHFFASGAFYPTLDGYSTLPLSLNKISGENRLPMAHTCSFGVDISSYTEREKLKDLLFYSIFENNNEYQFS